MDEVRGRLAGLPRHVASIDDHEDVVLCHEASIAGRVESAIGHLGCARREPNPSVEVGDTPEAMILVGTGALRLPICGADAPAVSVDVPPSGEGPVACCADVLPDRVDVPRGVSRAPDCSVDEVGALVRELADDVDSITASSGEPFWQEPPMHEKLTPSCRTKAYARARRR